MSLFTPNSYPGLDDDMKELSTYIPYDNYMFSVDHEERTIINKMLLSEYYVVGQLNADGSYDPYAQAYIDNEVEKIKGIKKKEEKEQEVKKRLRTRARNQKNHDGAAFVFAKISGTKAANFIEQIKKKKIEARENKNKPENAMDTLIGGARDAAMGALKKEKQKWTIGTRIPNTNLTILTILSPELLNLTTGGSAYRVGASDGTIILLDGKTGEILSEKPEQRVDRMAAVLDDIAHGGMSVVDKIFANLQEHKR